VDLLVVRGVLAVFFLLISEEFGSAKVIGVRI
jgi:hypothetical protein